ncbi:LysR family transcriptional regulator [Inhella sp.]|uniref:LysR family transcriptional regulator n=1 Tax=Inhella sp. TaxID=1921806 RepID=UPI0035B211AD
MQAPRFQTQGSPLDANALELFARVVQAGSFAAAARRLGQTRAAVSRRIAAIEAQIGQPLLARTTRSLALTEAGRRLAQRARAVLEAADAARGALRASKAGLAGRLRITALSQFGRNELLPLVAEFGAAHPGLRFELLFTDRRIDLLREGVDLAFRLTRKPPEDFVARPLLPVRIKAYARPGLLPLLDEPRALADAPLLLLGASRDELLRLRWLPSDPSGGLAASDGLVDVQGQVFSDDLDSLVGLALAGCGVVLAPDYSVRRQLAAGDLVDVLPRWQLPIPEGDCIQALTLPTPLAPESARAFVKFVAARLGANAPEGGISHV